MWYGGNHPDCNWGYAVSKDGSNFEKKGKISDLGEVEDIHVVHNKSDGCIIYTIGTDIMNPSASSVQSRPMKLISILKMQLILA